MVKGNILKDLITKIYQKDQNGIDNVIFEIIEQERMAKHFKISRELTKIVENYHTEGKNTKILSDYFRDIPYDRDRNVELFEVVWSKINLNHIILNFSLKQEINKLLREWNNRSKLLSYNMKPIKNIMFFGPPGCGKTLCASTIAGELNLPLIKIRTESIISSLLGETAINLKKIFNSIGEKRTAIIFFDEFDSLAKSRTDKQEHGEIRRSVSTLLQIIENSGSNLMIITATNHPEILDKATWRRFDLILNFSKPTNSEVLKLIKLKMKNFFHPSITIKDLSNLGIENLSHADIERACYDAIKEAILNNVKTINKSTLLKFINNAIQTKNEIDRILT
jgi:SpoVK/Ycf46/Vps4 family AAA+-type ATPase